MSQKPGDPLYDALTQAWLAAEEKLKSLRPVRPVWVAVNEYDLLGIVKHQNKWQLCLCYGRTSSQDPINAKPIIECPIKNRVDAAVAIQDLWQAMLKSKAEFAPEVEVAIERLSDFCKQPIEESDASDS